MGLPTHHLTTVLLVEQMSKHTHPTNKKRLNLQNLLQIQPLAFIYQPLYQITLYVNLDILSLLSQNLRIMGDHHAELR